MANKINSKKKGSKGERDLCKWWKEWTGQEFTRVPSSGGLRWSRTSDTTGDIINADKKHYLRFPFSIESKFHKEINFNDILRGNKSDIMKFWDQTLMDAKRGSKLPILFMRENGMPKNLYFVAIQPKVYKTIMSANTNMIEDDINEPKFIIHYKGMILYIIRSSQLLKINYSNIVKPLRKLLKSTKG